jgi:TPR repeat protein
MKGLSILWLGAMLAPLISYAQENFDRGLDAYLAGEYQQAYNIWKPLADGGDKVAMFNVGVLHAEGRGVAQDVQQATQWYRRAAEAGYAPAQFNLGSAYLEGKGVTEDKRQAFQWWTKAAAQNHPQSLFNLATLYLQGDGVEADQAQALALYRQAAEQGDERAREVVDEIKRSTAPVGRTPASAKSSASPATEAEPRPAKAAPGAGDAKSSRTAASAVAKAGAPAATARTEAPSGVRREPWIQSQNPQHVTIQLAVYSNEQTLQQFIAKHWLTEQPLAYFRVRQGTRFQYKLIYGAFKSLQHAKVARDGLPAVFKKQDPWIRPFGAVHAELKERGPIEGKSSPSRTRAGEVSTTKRVAAASHGWRRDSSAGADDAQIRNGQVAFNSQNYAKALEIWRPLAVRGVPAAQYNLGFMYESGWGVSRNDQEAAGWYQFAADQGHAKAQFNLGRLYMEGRGVDKNKGLGLYWIQNASDGDDERAVDYLKDYQARR